MILNIQFYCYYSKACLVPAIIPCSPWATFLLRRTQGEYRVWLLFANLEVTFKVLIFSTPAQLFFPHKERGTHIEQDTWVCPRLSVNNSVREKATPPDVSISKMQSYPPQINHYEPLTQGSIIVAVIAVATSTSTYITTSISFHLGLLVTKGQMCFSWGNKKLIFVWEQEELNRRTSGQIDEHTLTQSCGPHEPLPGWSIRAPAL